MEAIKRYDFGPLVGWNKRPFPKIHILKLNGKGLCNKTFKDGKCCRVTMKGIIKVHHSKLWCKRCLERYRKTLLPAKEKFVFQL